MRRIFFTDCSGKGHFDRPVATLIPCHEAFDQDNIIFSVQSQQ